MSPSLPSTAARPAEAASRTHLQRLEAESIHILREVVANADNPVMLYSVGKDSAVMLHRAKKAFHPAPPPFPLLHVDTTWKFRAIYELREKAAKDAGMDLIVHQNPEAQTQGITPFDHGAMHTEMWKTEGLKQALTKHGIDVAFGGARRDEAKSRAKERVFSFWTVNHRWDPKYQRPELWKLYNTRKAKGETIRILPSGRTTTVKSIVTYDGDLSCAVAGPSVTLAFAEEVDCSRGDVIAAAEAPCEVADQFEARLVWMDTAEMLPGCASLLKIGAQLVTATVTEPKYEVNVNTMDHLASKTLGLNAIGVVNISTDSAIPFEAYTQNPDLGGFILIDRMTNASIAAGLIHFVRRRSKNIHWQAVESNREAQAAQKVQKPVVVWFTGLSGSDKSTIAHLVEKKLHALGRHTFLLDGDNVRHGLNRDLGFTDADRVENIRRVGQVARLMTDAGLIVLTAFISPFRAERRMVRERMVEGEFLEVHVDTPLEVAEARDVKRLYKKSRTGLLKNFIGIDSPCEPPYAPEIVVDTVTFFAEEAADKIVPALLEH